MIGWEESPFTNVLRMEFIGLRNKVKRMYPASPDTKTEKWKTGLNMSAPKYIRTRKDVPYK